MDDDKSFERTSKTEDCAIWWKYCPDPLGAVKQSERSSRVLHSNYVLRGVFVEARRASNSQTLRSPARAVEEWGGMRYHGPERVRAIDRPARGLGDRCAPQR